MCAARAAQRVALLLLVLGLFSQEAGSDILGKKVVLMPFKDQTGFRGKWEIEREVPAYLGEILSESPFYEIVPMDSVYKTFKGQRVPKDASALSKMGKTLGADVVVTGEIDEFNVSRFGLGTPMVGGYEAHSAEVDVEVTLTRVVDGKQLGIVGGKGDAKERSAAMTLLGKPTARDSEFYGLDSIPFGSDQFKETIIGEACLKALEELKASIDELIGRPREVAGQVLMLADSEAVYLNVGIEDGLQLGDKLGVYEQGQELTDAQTGEVVGHADDRRIGSVQIVELKAAHFSKAKILEGRDAVAADHLVKTEFASTDEE